MLEALIPDKRAQGAMTLVVSARVPDGIVTAADSLATLSVQASAEVKGGVTCPECGKEHEATLPVELPPGIGTLSTMPYSLKLIPVHGKYALASFGTSVIGARSVSSLIMEFQNEHSEVKLVDEVARDIGKWLHERLAEVTDVSAMPEGVRALGFQLSGYRDGKPLVLVTSIGRDVRIEEYGQFGVTVSGETAIVTKLWELAQTHPQMSAAYQAWSVLDARDYAMFLIKLTADFQRFATMVPNVGGEIDIALVTPQRFSWIERKELADLLLQEGGSVEDDQTR